MFLNNFDVSLTFQNNGHFANPVYDMYTAPNASVGPLGGTAPSGRGGAALEERAGLLQNAQETDPLS